MANKIHYSGEVIGRFGVLLAIIITMNRTSWYQSLPFQTLKNASLEVWIFSLAIGLCLFWVILPILKELKTEVEDGE